MSEAEKPMKKAMSEYLQQVQEFYKNLNETKEDIIKAFIAKYGYQPDEIVLHEQTTQYGKQYWVDVKKDPDNTAEAVIEKISALVQYHSSGYALEISNLIEEYKGIK